MSKGNRVTLSKNTMNGLSKFAKPFESADDCLKRILNCKCIQNEVKKGEEDEVVESEEEE